MVGMSNADGLHANMPWEFGCLKVKGSGLLAVGTSSADGTYARA